MSSYFFKIASLEKKKAEVNTVVSQKPFSHFYFLLTQALDVTDNGRGWSSAADYLLLLKRLDSEALHDLLFNCMLL